MNAAIITENIVSNLIVIEQENVNAYSTTLPLGTIIVLSDIAAIGDSYNPETGEFRKQGESNGS